MVEKLRLSNDFLKAVIAIDPAAILTKTTVTLKAILHLPDIVTNVLSSIDLEDYEKGCRKIMVDPTLPPALVEKKFVRADTWWFKLKDKYPLLSKISLALKISKPYFMVPEWRVVLVLWVMLWTKSLVE